MSGNVLKADNAENHQPLFNTNRPLSDIWALSRDPSAIDDEEVAYDKAGLIGA